MSQIAQPTFECEICRRKYAWKAEIAGRKLRCKCGESIAVPATAPLGDDMYDLAPPPMPPAETIAKPRPMPVAQPVPESVPYVRPDPNAPMADGEIIYSKPRDLYIPAALVIFGTALQFLRAQNAPMNPIAWVGIIVTMDILITFVGILIAARMLSVGFGPIGTAALKLCAISLGPDSIALLFYYALGSGYGAMFAAILVSLSLYWCLFSYLFELDAQDTFYTVAIVYTLYMFTFYSIMFLAPSFSKS